MYLACWLSPPRGASVPMPTMQARDLSYNVVAPDMTSQGETSHPQTTKSLNKQSSPQPKSPKQSKEPNNYVRCNKGCSCCKGASFVFCRLAPVRPSFDGFCITCLLIRKKCHYGLFLQLQNLCKTPPVRCQTMSFLRQKTCDLQFVCGFPGDKNPTPMISYLL